MQRVGVIAQNLQAAAFGGAFRAEGTHDDVAAMSNCTARSLPRLRKK